MPAVIQASYPVTVKCVERTLAQMIEAGRYDEVDITSDPFPLSRTDDYEVVGELIYLSPESFKNRHSEIEMEKRDLRWPTIEECLAFGEEYPETQRQIPIICILRINDRQIILVLDSHAGRRRFAPTLRSVRWMKGYRFLAIRKHK